MNIATMILL